VTRLSEQHSEATVFSTVGEMSDPHIIARFTVDGDPVTKSRARWNSKQRRAYTPAKTVAAEAQVLALKAAHPEHRGDDKNTFGVVAIFHLNQAAVRRDVDNMLKLVLDALNKWAWKDDSQVTEVVGRKVPAIPATATRTEIVIYRTGIVAARGVEKTCEQCATVFHVPASADKRGKRFCSRACGVEWRKRARTRVCPVCHEEFVAHSQARAQEHCSVACKDDATRVDVTCSRCGAAFRKPRHLNRKGQSYCSEECKAAYWREQRRGAAKGTCGDCGGPTSKKSYRRCRTCAIAAGGAFADKAKCPKCDRHFPNSGPHRCITDPTEDRP
jgi:Holliday junction resolvase RusA-like endonuclease